MGTFRLFTIIASRIGHEIDFRFWFQPQPSQQLTPLNLVRSLFPIRRDLFPNKLLLHSAWGTSPIRSYVGISDLLGDRSPQMGRVKNSADEQTQPRPIGPGRNRVRSTRLRRAGWCRPGENRMKRHIRKYVSESPSRLYL